MGKVFVAFSHPFSWKGPSSGPRIRKEAPSVKHNTYWNRHIQKKIIGYNNHLSRLIPSISFVVSPPVNRKGAALLRTAQLLLYRCKGTCEYSISTSARRDQHFWFSLCSLSRASLIPERLLPFPPLNSPCLSHPRNPPFNPVRHRFAGHLSRHFPTLRSGWRVAS
jgi:hypothetical protein